MRITLKVVVFLLFSAVCVSAQNATRVRIEMDGIYGPLFVTIDGTEKKITEKAQQAWILSGGRYVVYSSSDGAGGYENEGQSLHLYDVRTEKQKRIMSSILWSKK